LLYFYSLFGYVWKNIRDYKDKQEKCYKHIRRKDQDQLYDTYKQYKTIYYMINKIINKYKEIEYKLYFIDWNN